MCELFTYQINEFNDINIYYFTNLKGQYGVYGVF